MYTFPLSPLSQKVKMELKQENDCNKIYASFLSPSCYGNKAASKNDSQYLQTLSNSFGLTQYSNDINASVQVHKPKEPTLKLISLSSGICPVSQDLIDHSLDEVMKTISECHVDAELEKLKSHESIDGQCEEYSKQECSILTVLSSTLDILLTKFYDCKH